MASYGSVCKVKLNSGYAMPTLGYGTYLVSPGEAFKSAYEAIKLGYNLIDTASYYRNEKEIGMAISKAVKDNLIKREDLFVTTKVWTSDFGIEETTKSVENSLKLLGDDVKYLDLVLLHWPSDPIVKDHRGDVFQKRIDAWTALENLVEKKLIKSIGVSNFLPKHLTTFLEAKRSDGKKRIVPAVNQVELHLLCYQSSLDILKCCKSHNIIVQAYSPLARGKIITADSKFVDKITQIAKPSGLSYIQAALKFLIQSGCPIVVKAASEKNMKANIELCGLNDLKDEAVEEMIDILSDESKLGKYGATQIRCAPNPAYLP